MPKVRIFRLVGGVLWVIAATEPRAIAQGQLVRAELRATLYFINVDYGEQRVRGQGVILRGEPLDIDIRLANQGRVGSLAVGAEREWMDRVTVRVRPGGYRDSAATGEAMPCTWLPSAHRSQGLTTQDQEHIVLNAGASVTARCRIDSSSLSGGKHTATVDWLAGTERASFRDLIPQEHPIVIEFELRELATEVDELDQLLHLALRAIDEGRLASASQLVDSALVREPFSSPALILRGRIHVARGACAAAAADWQLAARVIENETDSKHQRHRIELDGDEPRRAAASWRARAQQLRCK